MNVIPQWFTKAALPFTPLRDRHVARIGVGHALIDDCSSTQVCETIISHALHRGRPSYVITSNAQHIVLLEKDRRLQEVFAHADLVVADGISVVMAAWLYGRSLQQRVAGVDMFRALCGMAAEANLHVFLLGGRPGSAELAANALQADYPNLKYTTCCPAFGFEQDPVALKETADAIRSARPDILFVALGAPKQEYWIYEHGLQLAVPVSVGVGGSFEIVGGVIPRAPIWAQNIGCEWLYRLCREPRRMWRRYLIGNLEFAAIVVRQRVRRVLLNAFVHLINEDRFAAELSELAFLQQTRSPEGRPGIGPQEVETMPAPVAVNE